MSNNMSFEELLTASEKTDLTILIAAKEEAKRAVMGNPSKANLDAYEKASSMVESFKKAKSGDDGVVYKDRLAVVNYLKSAGYKVGKSKLYSDAAAGFLKVENDGTITGKSLDRYIKRIGLKRLSEVSSEMDSDKTASMAIEKAKKENEKLDEQIKKLRFERRIAEGKYMLKSDHTMDVIGRTGLLDDSLTTRFRVASEQIVKDVSFGRIDAEGVFAALCRIKDEILISFVMMDSAEIVIEAGNTEPHDAVEAAS